MKMERSINKFLDTVNNLEFSQEQQVTNTTQTVKTLLIASKQLYKDMKRIKFKDNKKIFDIFG